MSLFRSFILSLIILIWSFSPDSVLAAWQKPGEAPPNGNTPPPINVGTTKQEKTSALTVGNFEARSDGWVQGRVYVSKVPDLRSGGQSTVSAGDVKAARFCLGNIPSPDGCISSWQEGLGLSGGQANRLVRWLSPITLDNSSISESGTTVTIGSTATPKNVKINGNVSLGGGAPAASSGLKLKGFSNLTASEIASLASKNIVLSVDTLTGEVKLVEACKN